jgi:hypothetical protein
VGAGRGWLPADGAGERPGSIRSPAALPRVHPKSAMPFPCPTSSGSHASNKACRSTRREYPRLPNRLKSARAATTWKTSLPPGVVMSIASCRLRNPMPRNRVTGDLRRRLRRLPGSGRGPLGSPTGSARAAAEQRRLHAHVQECGHHRDGDAAFAAQHQRDPSVGEDLAHPHAGLAEHTEYGLEIVGPALVRVGPPPHHRQVAIVRDAHAGRGQPLGQAELTHHRRPRGTEEWPILRPSPNRPLQAHGVRLATRASTRVRATRPSGSRVGLKIVISRPVAWSLATAVRRTAVSSSQVRPSGRW